MMHRDFWRTGRWHTGIAEFQITQGPEVTFIGTDRLTIRWSMSEVSSGQIEYGKTTAYGLTSTEQVIGGGYSTHEQTITGLDSGTTYYFRTKSTSAAAVTVYSLNQSGTTTGVNPPSGVGPRYGAAGWPGFATASWPALPGAYTLVPASVLTASNVASALATFLNGVADGTTVVFDRTELGAGTTYDLGTSSVELDSRPGNQAGLTFWMYNTTFTHAASSASWASGFLSFRFGGYTNLSLLGGEFAGPNTAAGTWACRSIGNENGHAVHFDSAYTDLTIQDMYIHDVTGEAIMMGGLGPEQTWVNFGTLGPPTDLEISYNHVDGTGRQGIVIDQNTRAQVHHNVVRNTALAGWDAEDESSAQCRHIDLEITDNVFENWNWHLTTSSYWMPEAFLFTRRVNTQAIFGEMTNITLARNRFIGGARGFGNPSAEVTVLGSNHTDGYGPILWFKVDEGGGKLKTNVQIVDNVFDLPADQDRSRTTGGDYGDNGNFLIIDNCNGLTVTGNTGTARGIYYRSCSNVTVSGVTGTVDS